MSTETKERPFSCKLCDKRFTLPYSLRRHIAIHDAPIHFCKQCDKVFRSKDLLKRHGSVHSNNRPYKCKLCNKNFKTVAYVKSHLKLHQNKAKLLQACVNKSARIPGFLLNTPERKAALKAAEPSLAPVTENQRQKADSVPEFDEPSKITSVIVDQSSCTATHLACTLTGGQREQQQPKFFFIFNDSAAVAENRVTTVYVGTATGESNHAPGQGSSDRFQITFKQIMDELKIAGSKTVNDAQF